MTVTVADRGSAVNRAISPKCAFRPNLTSSFGISFGSFELAFLYNATVKSKSEAFNSE